MAKMVSSNNKNLHKGIMNIWKVSHGSYFFSQEENEELFKRRCVCVHPNTSSKGRSSITQGENFANVTIGDYFYLCYSNERIRLFGKFIGKKHESILPNKKGWLEQEYELLYESVKKGGYVGEKYWWTPNDNSTFIKVSDINLFEEVILKPFFGKMLGNTSLFSTKLTNNIGVNSNVSESSAKAEVAIVQDILRLNNLTIPNYQRPYRWSENNVRQLLEDILESKNSGKKTYRIGSLILHDSKEGLNIVDGQQRLTTLCLIQKACKETDNERLRAAATLKFNHNDSTKHIRENYLFIKEWLEEYCNVNQGDFWDYICKSCDLVKIVVSDLSEAFQMFDSQNGRGKELEHYNLLKAYHIRAMEQDSREEKIRCDQQWEAATQFDATPNTYNDPNIDVLQLLFSEQLYRSRIWSRQKDADEFTKKHIDEFKGFTIDKNHPASFPYQNPQLLQYLTSKFYKNVLSGTVATTNRFEFGDNERIDPFVNINQPIVNGKSFFEYIETYVEIYKRLFIEIGTYQLAEFKEFYYSFVLNYGDKSENRKKERAFYPKYPASRTGDTYLRECYKSLIFVLFDKFGEKGLRKFYKTLYRLIYQERIAKTQVKYNYVAQLPNRYFKVIVEAKDLSDLSKLDKYLSDSLKDIKYNDKLNSSIKNFIITGKID